MQYAKMTKEFRKIYRNIGNMNNIIFVIIALSVLFVKPSWCASLEHKFKKTTLAVVSAHRRAPTASSSAKTSTTARTSRSSRSDSSPCSSGFARLTQGCLGFMVFFQALKLYYNKTQENVVELLTICLVSAADVSLVLFYPKHSADFCCLLRICFVVFMK